MTVLISVGETSRAVELVQVPLHLAHRQAAGIQRDHLVVEARQPPLMLGDQLRLEGAGPIARHRQRQRPGVGLDRLRTRAIAVIARRRIGRRLGLQVVPQLRRQGPLGQGLLDLGEQAVRPRISSGRSHPASNWSSSFGSNVIAILLLKNGAHTKILTGPDLLLQP